MKSFEDFDQLDRSGFGAKIALLVDKSKDIKAEGSLVIALDSPWGTGKTTTIEMWKNKEEEGTDNLIILHNAWEEDDFDSPLISVLENLINAISDIEGDQCEKKDQLIKAAKEIIGYILKKGVEKAVSAVGDIKIDELKDIMNRNKRKRIFKGFKESQEPKQYTEYQDYCKLKNQFRKLLAEICKEKKLVFIIDELDRCNPLYSVKMLETVKHFFNIPNMVFIFSVDLVQLGYSISTIYGEKMDAYGYLKKFFDIHIKLSKPSNKKYVAYLAKVFDISLLSFDYNLIDTICSTLVLTLRDIDVIMNSIRLSVILEKIQYRRSEYLEIWFYLLALKHKYPEIYETVLFKRFLSDGDSSAGSYKTVDDMFFRPTLNVEKFMQMMQNGKNVKSVNSIVTSKGLSDLIISSYDMKNVIQSEMSISEYLEKRIELF